MPGERPAVRGYVLAGGLSSRMGENKAAVRLGERSFLEISVKTLHAVTPDVTIVGQQLEVLPSMRNIRDEFPGCGPMGGMEAALRDCAERGGMWAAFVPVDTPLLPGGLLGALVELWTGSHGVRAGVAVIDGRMQPLVCALHVDLVPVLRAHLERGEYKVQPMLRAAGAEAAKSLAWKAEEVLLLTDVSFGEGEVLAAGRPLGWRPSGVEWGRREMWFANANTPEELLQIRARLEKEVQGLLFNDRAEHLKVHP